MLFILVFAVIPTIGVGTSFFHNGGKTSGNTDTAFDTLSASAPASLKIPAAWFIVWKLNGGITSVMRAALPNDVNVRQALAQFQDLMISDSRVSSEVAKFNSNCHQPALASYNALSRAYPGSALLANINNDLESSVPFTQDRFSENPQPIYNVNYQGNAGFMNNLYTGNVPICTSTQDPNTVACLPPGVGIDNTMVRANSTGFQNCNEWWSGAGGVATKVRDHMATTRANEIPVVDMLFNALGIAPDIAERNITSKALNSFAAPDIRSPYSEGTWNSLKQGAGAAALTWVNWLAQFLNTMITAFLPQLHAVMILLLLIMAPVISIIGLARPSAIMRLLLVAFIINLWIPIWIIVNWVDNVLLSLLYENRGWIAETFDMGYVLASLLTLSLYTAIPLLASFYIFTATNNGIANQTRTMAGAGGVAGTAAGSAAGGAAMSAGRRGLGAATGAGRLAGRGAAAAYNAAGTVKLVAGKR